MRLLRGVSIKDRTPREFANPAPTRFETGRTGLGSILMSLDASQDSSLRGPVFFHRLELDAILRLYGRMVAAGEWRDYSLGGHDDSAAFAVFRRTGDAPLYVIEKRPELQRRQGQWAILGQGGLVLKRGHELTQVLRFFDRRRFSVVD